MFAFANTFYSMKSINIIDTDGEKHKAGTLGHTNYLKWYSKYINIVDKLHKIHNDYIYELYNNRNKYEYITN